MKPVLTRLTLALFVLVTLVAVVIAEQQPQSVLGKINFAALFDAAPAMPATTQEAAKRTYGSAPNPGEDPSALHAFYDPFNQRLEAARAVIKPAVDARPAHQEAMAQQAIADAEKNPIISGMGGIDKMSEMSDEERERAAMQALGNYQQSLAGGPGQTSAGMQAVMQRVMNDPAYRERFEKNDA